MAKYRLKLAAATWTDLAAALTGLSGVSQYIVRSNLSDLSVAAKATAPTSGTAVAAGKSAQVFLDGTRKGWAYSTAGGVIEIDDSGAPVVIGALTHGADA